MICLIHKTLPDTEVCRERRRTARILPHSKLWPECGRCGRDLGPKPAVTNAPPKRGRGRPRKEIREEEGSPGRPHKPTSDGSSPSLATTFTEVKLKCRQSSVINRQAASPGVLAGPQQIASSDNRDPALGNVYSPEKKGGAAPSRSKMSTGETSPGVKTEEGRATGKDAPRPTIVVESGWVKASVEAATKPKEKRSVGRPPSCICPKCKVRGCDKRPVSPGRPKAVGVMKWGRLQTRSGFQEGHLESR